MVKKLLNSLIISVVIFSIAIVNPVSAFDQDFYSANDILFYNENDVSCQSITNLNVSYSASSLENQETVAKFLASTNFVGNNNQPLNPVQIAAIMGNLQQESGFNPEAGVSNNASYKGIAQWGSGRWSLISNPKTDILNQLNFIKTELDRSDYISNLGDFWNISNFSDIDEATFLIARNYEIAINDGGGEKTWSTDANATTYIQSWANRRDYARSLYEKYSNISGAGIICAGMTENQAKAYANTYETSDGKNLYQKYACDGYSSNETDAASKNILANCVAVVVYFLQNHTTFGDSIGLPNGGQVVQTLIQHGFIDGGNTPQPYAVFSTQRYGSSAGHTGLVLGVEDDNIIVFEEGCGQKLSIDGSSWSGVKKYSMSEATSLYTYAYPPEGTLKNL